MKRWVRGLLVFVTACACGGCALKGRSAKAYTEPPPPTRAVQPRPAPAGAPVMVPAPSAMLGVPEQPAMPAAAAPVGPAGGLPLPGEREVGGVDASAYRLRTGDPIVVYLRGIPGASGGEQSIEAVINEDGEINLPFIRTVKAAGKTATELEQDIQDAYINQQIYKYITVNVVVPVRSYYVRGEIRAPGRFALISEVTLVQAVAAAGGFTEFANPTRVEILRGKTRFSANVRDLERHPERDIKIQSGDVIIVPRSFF